MNGREFPPAWAKSRTNQPVNKPTAGRVCAGRHHLLGDQHLFALAVPFAFGCFHGLEGGSQMSTVGQERSSAEPGFRIYPRTDCEERFTVVTPNGCALPLRPLWENEAQFLVDTLNVFVEE